MALMSMIKGSSGGEEISLGEARQIVALVGTGSGRYESLVAYRSGNTNWSTSGDPRSFTGDYISASRPVSDAVYVASRKCKVYSDIDGVVKYDTYNQGDTIGTFDWQGNTGQHVIMLAFDAD